MGACYITSYNTWPCLLLRIHVSLYKIWLKIFYVGLNYIRKINKYWYVMSFCGGKSKEANGIRSNTVPSPHASTNTNETNDAVDINV